MSKDQVWKSISFSHTNTPKKVFFRLFPAGKMTKLFSMLFKTL